MIGKASSNPKRFAVIGSPISHSLSPLIHNAGYRSLSLNNQMVALEVPLDGATERLQALADEGFFGLAVTMPLKEIALKCAVKIDECALKIGAANTLVFDDFLGGYVAHNTDWLGIREPLLRCTTITEKKVAILGAGGAARAAIYACQSEGAKITILNRTHSKGAQVASAFRVEFEVLAQGISLSNFDVVINATPIGLTEIEEDCALFSSFNLRPNQIVFETNYKSTSTPLTTAAQEVGATLILGQEMFLEQAYAQFAIHSLHEAPREAMSRALREHRSFKE